ncbi:MAG: glycosyltransferase family 39 protein [Candidatus Omnitrophica bacterium]|nr:glycosyltransferase family 39 protein [Candidatus Omnitrophota bacterium]
MMFLILLKAVTVFLLITLSAWGIGDWITSFVLKRNNHLISKLAKMLISFSVGLGLIGQSIFIAGLAGDFYQEKYFWAFFFFLGTFSIYRYFAYYSKETIPKFSFFKDVKIREIIIVVLVIVLFIVWFYSAINFTRGSDVISHHYQHAKECIRQRHFAHIYTLPSGYDHVANYNPTMLHMLYLGGKILSDDRAANLLHWFTLVMLIASIYVFARDYFSRLSAFMSVAVFLGFRAMFNYSVDVGDYPALAVFMMMSLYCLFAYRKTNSIRFLLLGGLLSGLMLSTKYFGIPMIIALSSVILIGNDLKLFHRIRASCLFFIIAFIIYSPWLIYSFKEFSNPIYPYFSKVDFLVRLWALTKLNILDRFISVTDISYFWSKFLYYTSIFIPFEPTFNAFGLTPLILIGFPCSVYYCLFKRNNPRFTDINLLFIVSLIAYFSVELPGKLLLWYKFAFFAGIIYAISFSAMYNHWKASALKWVWVGVIFVATLNTFLEVKSIKDNYLRLSPFFEQKEVWLPLEKCLNETLKENAVVANHDIHTNYYLRPDIVGYPSHETSIDWSKEESIIRNKGVQYYVFNPSEKMDTVTFYQNKVNLLIKMSDYEKAEVVRDTLNLYLERTDKQEAFLKKVGIFLNELPDGKVLYLLNLDEKSKIKGGQ